jgi:CheY-like chemotaxis protein/anti-sigma regulatory factor (Ser/Thr protein kinase)
MTPAAQRSRRTGILGIRTPAEAESAVGAVAAAMTKEGYPARDVFAVRLALDEALVNALKHGHGYDPAKEARVRFAVTADEAAVQVEDQGPGFDPSLVPDPLAEGNLEKGSGRGLLLMRHYLDEVRYNGRGNAVTLRKRRSGPRVLVIEDQPDCAESLRMLLEFLGYEARVAYSGDAGVREAREWGPDVVLSDLGLPGLDGYAVARELRGQAATAGARLIAVTGYGSDEARRRAREAGFEHHLVKPLNFDALRDLLGRN